MIKSINPKENKVTWVEKYRPNSVDDLISQEFIKDTMKQFIKKKRMPHLLFYGPPGTGKTSTILSVAKIIYGVNYKNMILELNASDDRNIKVVREQIKEFAKTQNNFSIFMTDKSNMVKYKLIILDEIDSMTQDAQFCLRRIMETYSDNTRFCLICNYINKVIPALQSRCCKVLFSQLDVDLALDRLQDICKDENIDYEVEALRSIIVDNNGDMRKCINMLQAMSLSYGKISKKDTEIIDSCMIDRIFNILLNTSENEIIESFLEIYIESKLSTSDIIKCLIDRILKLNLENQIKNHLVISLAKIDSYGSLRSNYIIISQLTSIFMLLRESLKRNINLLELID